MLHRLLPWLVPCLLLVPLDPAHARRERLDLHLTSVQLPGAPSIILSPDLNGDGHRDLVVLVTFTEWDQMAIEETTTMDDIEGLVEVMTIVPALADRRQLHVFLSDGEGGYRPGDHREIGTEVLALEEGPTAEPLLALTDEGLSAVRWHGDAPAGERLHFEPLLDEIPVLAGSRTFVPHLDLTHDLDGNGHRDILLPATAGPSVYLGDTAGLQTSAVGQVPSPLLEQRAGARPSVIYPLPRVEDMDGDGVLDLLFLDDEDADALAIHVYRGLGGGQFEALPEPLTMPDPCPDDDCPEGTPQFVHFGDLDGDGKAEYIQQEEIELPGDGIRENLRHAKRPPFRYRLFHSGENHQPVAEPYVTFEALGYTFTDGDSEDDGVAIPGGLQDLDGDGRQDLITLTLDFSVLQVMQVMTTRRISIGLDFHVYCQQGDGSFQAVPDLDLSGKFKINLNDVQVRQLSFFDGDFDGDGRADFVQVGRGKTVSIHRGGEGCTYAAKPDLTLKLDEEPRNVALVRIEDYDADGFSDLLIVQPNRIEEAGVTPPVRLDLYLSHQFGEGASR